MRSWIVAVIWMVAGLSSPMAEASESCQRALEVVGAQAAFETERKPQGTVLKRVRIEARIENTSTVSVGAIELGVFLGASLLEVSSTRPEGLPTRNVRRLDGGGVAFRGYIETFLPPKTTRTIRFQKDDMPHERDHLGLTVVVVDCRWLKAVGQDVRVEVRPPGPEAPLGWIIAGMIVLGLLTISVLWRLR